MFGFNNFFRKDKVEVITFPNGNQYVKSRTMSRIDPETGVMQEAAVENMVPDNV